MKKMHKQFFSLFQKAVVAVVIVGLLASSLPLSVVFASEDAVSTSSDSSAPESRSSEESSVSAQEGDVVSAPDKGDSLSPSDTSGTDISTSAGDTSYISTSNRGGSRGSSRSQKRVVDTPVAPLMFSSEIADFQSLPTYGEITNTVQINDLTEGGPALAQNDSYARSIANIGDLNGDGITDIASGAYNGGVNNEGELHISFLNTNGSVLSTATIGDGKGNGPTLADGDHYGSAVTGLGDLNNDGVLDIAVAAYYDDTTAQNAGALYIHFMNANGSVKSTKKITASAQNGFTLAENDHYGNSISEIGDLDNDGVVDIAVGTHYDDTNGTNRGAIYIHFLNTNGTVKSTKKISDATANGPVLVDNDNFGQSIAGMGDMNEDGVVDIAVGSYSTAAGLTNSGAVHILYMNADGSVDDTFAINAATTNGPVLSALDYF